MCAMLPPDCPDEAHAHSGGVWHARYRPGRGVPVRSILAPLRHGGGDPTVRLVGANVCLAVHTPEGPATSVWFAPGDGADVLATGPGGQWLSDHVSAMLGHEDDPSTFRPELPRLQQALRQPEHRDWRLTKTSLVVATLIPTVIEQKVTVRQAFTAYRDLVHRYGHPAPDRTPLVSQLESWGVAREGVVAALEKLLLPPNTSEWKRVPSWAWLQAGVQPAQSRTIMRALDVADRLEETANMPLIQAYQRLRSVPGIGVWTANKVAQTAWGDADAPTFGDFHVAQELGHATVGHDVDDAGMAQLLEPFRPHRYRAERLILAVGASRPRHGARLGIPAHLPIPVNRRRAFR